MTTRTPAETCRLAAGVLDLEASCLLDSHSVDGRWKIEDAADQSAKDDHEAWTALADELRELAEKLETAPAAGLF